MYSNLSPANVRAEAACGQKWRGRSRAIDLPARGAGAQDSSSAARLELGQQGEAGKDETSQKGRSHTPKRLESCF